MEGGGATDSDPTTPARAASRRFGAWMLLILVVALAVRAGYAASWVDEPVGGDPAYYHGQANLVADGKGFANPYRYELTGELRAAAEHPPLYVTYLALWSWLGADTPTWHRAASVLVGTLTVLLVGLAGRVLGGDRVGLVAALLAALAPNLWSWDGRLYSETMAAAAVALFLLATARYLERPAAGRLALVGLAAGLAAMARSELALLAVAVLPLAWRTTGLGPARRAGWVAGAVAAAAVVLAPWAAHNQSRFEEPVLLSSGAGLVLVSSSCDSTWYGDLIGYWDFSCSVAGEREARADLETDGSRRDAALRAVASRYVGDNASRAPAVVAARLGRVAGVFRPTQQVGLARSYEGGDGWVTGGVLGTTWLFLALAAAGAVVLRRHGVPLLALTAPVTVAVLVTAATYGIWRFRAPADVALVLLAAVAVDALVRRFAEHGAAPQPGSLLARFGAAGAAEADPA